MDDAEPRRAPAIEFVDITVSHGEGLLLDGLSLTVPAGETTILMGPSGVGKTTLIKHLLGLQRPDDGTVLVDGRSVWDLKPAELADLCSGYGVLLGGNSVYDTSVFGSMTVLENVAYPLVLTGIGPVEANERAARWLADFGLTPAADSLPGTLSAGARRRVALAKALITESALLVLDEPGTAMDVVTRAAVARAVAAAQARSATVLMVTHHIALAKRFGHHLAVLMDGRVAAYGPPGELLAGVDDAGTFATRFPIEEHLTPHEALQAGLRASRYENPVPWFWTLVAMAAMLVAVSLVLTGLIPDPVQWLFDHLG